MKSVWLLTAFLLTGPSAFAAGLVLDGPAFSVPEISITWNATANGLPTNLWIYKVVPQNFSPAVVSNLMALGGFTAKDRTHIEGQPPFKDERLMYFANKERTRHLGIFPPLGWLYYRDERDVVGGKERAKGVPGETEVLKLALHHLDNLGVSRSELVTKDDGSDFQIYRVEQDRGWFDKTKQEQVKEIILRGVSFVRRIDEVSFTGRGSDGGFSVSFGNEGKVASLELLWRNLQRHESRKVASPSEIVERLKAGQAKLVPLVSADLVKAKKLTINKATPYYLGESSDARQEFVYPFGALQCTLDYLDGGSIEIVLKCPIIVEE